MDSISEPIETPNPAVRKWGYLENWKSTAPVMACA